MGHNHIRNVGMLTASTRWVHKVASKLSTKAAVIVLSYEYSSHKYYCSCGHIKNKEIIIQIRLNHYASVKVG